MCFSLPAGASGRPGPRARLSTLLREREEEVRVIRQRIVTDETTLREERAGRQDLEVSLADPSPHNTPGDEMRGSVVAILIHNAWIFAKIGKGPQRFLNFEGNQGWLLCHILPHSF